MKEEFEEATKWVKYSLSFGNAGTVSVFETTMSAYDLSGNTVFLDRAKQLGDLLMSSIGTRSGIPTAWSTLRRVMRVEVGLAVLPFSASWALCK